MSYIYPPALNNVVPLSKKDSRTIVFIDSSVADCESIAQRVIPQARVIIIGSEDNGVKEISRVLNSSNCLEIHIFSLGIPGCVYLGNSELSIDSFKIYCLLLKNWFNNKSTHNITNYLPQIHLYSLNLNIGDVGEEFVTKLNQITAAEIFTASHANGAILSSAK